MRQHGFGRLPLPRDDRDWMLPLERAANPLLLPSPRRFWSMVNPDFRLDQGMEGTCMAHGETNVLLAGPEQHPTFPSFDTVEDAHQFARKLYLDATGDTSYQQGAYTRQGLDVLKARGQIGAYYRVPASDVVETVRSVGPVTFGATWYESMDYYRTKLFMATGKSYLRVDTSSRILGGHLWAFTGVDTEPEVGPPYLRGENSWGPDFMDDGTFRIAISDVLDKLWDDDCFFLAETAF